MEYWIGALLAGSSAVVAVALLIVGLPGTWLVWLTAAAFAWWTNFTLVSFALVLCLLVLAVAAELLEFWLGTAAAAKVRASWKVTAGALAGGVIGAIVGAPFLFGVGALLGSLAGTFLGAAAGARADGGSLSEVLAVARAALRGRWRGFVAKVLVTLVMSATFLLAVLV